MYIQRFLQYIQYERNLSKLTVSAYGKDLEQFSDFLTAGKEDLQPETVTASDVRAWVVSLVRHGDSQRTVRRKVQAVRAFYRYLMKQGIVTSTPAASVGMAKVPKRLPHFVREKLMDTVLDAKIDMADFAAVRDHLMIMMLYETGMRRAELIGLLDRHVDVEQRQLKVHGKRDKERIIPFGEELAAWIAAYRLLRDKQVGRGCEMFFVTVSAKPVYPALVYRVVHDTLKQAGATGKVSPHVLRHSFASVMLNSGAEINGVKELLGHESLAATQVYTHITFSELKNNYKLAHPRALKKGGHYGS